MSHTPGPWKLLGWTAPDDYGWAVRIGDAPHRIEISAWDASSESDALLIAAAPELLEALESLLSKLNGYEHHPDLCSRTAECDELEPDEFCSQCGDEVCPACECGLDKTQRAMEAAAAAIAKARRQ